MNEKKEYYKKNNAYLYVKFQEEIHSIVNLPHGSLFSIEYNGDVVSLFCFAVENETTCHKILENIKDNGDAFGLLFVAEGGFVLCSEECIFCKYRRTYLGHEYTISVKK